MLWTVSIDDYCRPQHIVQSTHQYTIIIFGVTVVRFGDGAKITTHRLCSTSSCLSSPCRSTWLMCPRFAVLQTSAMVIVIAHYTMPYWLTLWSHGQWSMGNAMTIGIRRCLSLHVENMPICEQFTDSVASASTLCRPAQYLIGVDPSLLSYTRRQWSSASTVTIFANIVEIRLIVCRGCDGYWPPSLEICYWREYMSIYERFWSSCTQFLPRPLSQHLLISTTTVCRQICHSMITGMMYGVQWPIYINIYCWRPYLAIAIVARRL